MAKTKPKTKTMHVHSASSLDRDYVSALAAANRFLYAWQAQDEENGVLMLTEAAKQHTTEDHLDAFFSPAQGSQQSYQIARGKELGATRYSFPVALIVAFEGKPSVHPRYSQIVMIKNGDDWVVDRLP